MKIDRVESLPLRIPFKPAGVEAEAKGFHPLDILLVKVTADSGQVGWGEAFSYNSRGAVQWVLDEVIAPIATGREFTDIPELMTELQQIQHRFGRYGIAMFAFSGLDIALWDLAAKAEDVPLSFLLGGEKRDEVPAYASLVPLGNPETVGQAVQAALAEGYGRIKLHELEAREVKAARDAAGADVPIMIDVNCAWDFEEAKGRAGQFKPYNPLWFEEPVFPPEDSDTLAALRKSCGIPIAAGENACTLGEFMRMFTAEAVDVAQPSVSKMGGVTEFRKVAALATMQRIEIMPHSPYFGPGYLATLHLMAGLTGEPFFEQLYVTPEAGLYGDLARPTRGILKIPDQAGLGPDPDPGVIKECRVGASIK